VSRRGGEGSAFAFGRAAHLVLLRHHLDLQLDPRALRDYGRRPALLAAKSALQLALQRLELDAHLIRVRALCAQLLGELPNAPLGRHARRGDRRAHPLGLLDHWRSEPAGAEQLELGHGGLLHHLPAELRTGTGLRTRRAQLAQLGRSLRVLLRRSRHAHLDARQQALAGRDRFPALRRLEASRLPAEEVVQQPPAAPPLCRARRRRQSAWSTPGSCPCCPCGRAARRARGGDHARIEQG